MNFTHLHVHTEYSLLDGSNKIKEYVDRVKELGMDSAAITDHGVMYGVIDFTVRQELRESIRSWAVRCMLRRAPALTVKQEVEKTVITIWFFWQRTTRVTVI